MVAQEHRHKTTLRQARDPQAQGLRAQDVASASLINYHFIWCLKSCTQLLEVTVAKCFIGSVKRPLGALIRRVFGGGEK